MKLTYPSYLERYDQEMFSSAYDEFYDQSGFFNFGYWISGTRNPKEAGENLVERLLGLSERKGANILDVACGLGATTNYLLKYYPPKRVTGINMSQKQLASSRRRAPHCEFVLMDAASLAFRDEEFDTVFCCEAVFHFNTRLDFLRQAYRVLKPGGCLLLSDIVFVRLPPNMDAEVPKSNFINNVDEYKSMYQTVGFKDVKVVDATNQCWKGWRKYMMKWAFRQLISGAIPLSTYVGLCSGPVSGTFGIRKYLLISAQRPL